MLKCRPRSYVNGVDDKKHLLCWTSFKTTEKSLTIGQISPSLGHQKSECLAASGGFAPLPPDQGPCPWALDPAGGDPCYRLVESARHHALPKLNSWIRPWLWCQLQQLPAVKHNLLTHRWDMLWHTDRQTDRETVTQWVPCVHSYSEWLVIDDYEFVRLLTLFTHVIKTTNS